jgi:hypothetical protein
MNHFMSLLGHEFNAVDEHERAILANAELNDNGGITRRALSM